MSPQKTMHTASFIDLLGVYSSGATNVDLAQRLVSLGDVPKLLDYLGTVAGIRSAEVYKHFGLDVEMSVLITILGQENWWKRLTGATRGGA